MNYQIFESACIELQSNDPIKRKKAEEILLNVKQMHHPYNFCKDVIGNHFRFKMMFFVL